LYRVMTVECKARVLFMLFVGVIQIGSKPDEGEDSSEVVWWSSEVELRRSE